MDDHPLAPKPKPQGSKHLGPLLVVTLLVSVGAGYTCFGAPGMIACGQATGYAPSMLESVGACAAAVDKLGAPVRYAFVGGGCGNYEAGAEGGDGHAWGSLRVEGPKSHASLEYDVSKSGGRWHASMLVLTFPDGAKLDVQACTQGLEQQRSDEAMRKILEQQCQQGQAARCQALGAWLAAHGDAAGAAQANQQACTLGLASACAKPQP